MFDPFGDRDSSYWITFFDFMSGVLAVFLVVAVLMLMHFNEQKQKNKETDIHSPGTVMVEAFWKEDADVDVWVKSPNDIPVGYSRKSGKFFDLLRDDLGRKYEKAASLHHENVYSRNAPEGEYIVNLHMYSNFESAQFPIEVEVVVQVVKTMGDNYSPITRILRTKIPLTKLAEEVTVVRFRLDTDANIVPDSINHEQMPLREKK